MLEKIKQTCEFLKKKGIYSPEIGIVLGTGLGKLVDEIKIDKVIEYTECCSWPRGRGPAASSYPRAALETAIVSSVGTRPRSTSTAGRSSYGTQNRGGLVSGFVVIVGVPLVSRTFGAAMAIFALAVVLILSLLYATNARVDLGTRELSVRQLIDN